MEIQNLILIILLIEVNVTYQQQSDKAIRCWVCGNEGNSIGKINRDLIQDQTSEFPSKRQKQSRIKDKRGKILNTV